jgi:hypothetical protein
MSGSELLDGATFGIFSRWRDSDRQLLAQAAAKIIDRALRATGSSRLEGDRVEVDLPDEKTWTTAIDRLERADPSDPSRNLEGVLHEQPSLFDEVPASPGDTRPTP